MFMFQYKSITNKHSGNISINKIINKNTVENGEIIAIQIQVLYEYDLVLLSLKSWVNNCFKFQLII